MQSIASEVLYFPKPRCMGSLDLAEIARIDSHLVDTPSDPRAGIEVIYDLDGSVQSHQDGISTQACKMLAELLLGIDIDLAALPATKIYHQAGIVLPGEQLLTNGVWHFDNGVFITYSTDLTTRFAFGQCDERIVRALPGASSIRTRIIGALNDRLVTTDELGLELFTAEPGEVVLFDRRCPHAGQFNKTDHPINKSWTTLQLVPPKDD